jgi:hypothetical protein
MTRKKKQGSSIARIALAAWSIVSALLALSSLAIFLLKGANIFSVLITESPYSDLSLTLVSTLLAWLLAGAFLHLLYFRVFKISNALTWAGFFVVALVYVNILRERVRYGDIGYYVDAALALHKGGPLPGTYIYPLLWVSVLEIFVPFKEAGIFLFAWILNVAALFGLYFLLARMLEKYGFSANLAALVTTVFMLVNVPLLRTMVYGQVNLLVLDGILLSLLLYRRFPFLSALALTVAVQMKISPIVIVAAVLLERNWRWLGWFVLNMLVVGLIPVMVHGVQPYADVVNNLARMGARTSFYFRDTSIDSFLLATGSFMKVDPTLTRLGIYASKLAVGLFALWTAWLNVHKSTFFSQREAGNTLYNAAPVLMILMTLASPLMWEHHGVFLALPFLVLLKRIEGNTEWFLFGSAYFFEFGLPSFDFYPWSYVRLLAPLIVLWLSWAVTKRTRASKSFAALDRRANALLAVKE